MGKPFVIEDPNREYLEAARSQGQAAAPATPASPPSGEFKFIGKYTPRVDGARIVTGAAHYTHDLYFDGMLHGKILRSPHAAAEVISMDLSAALAYPGVKTVLRLKEGRVRWVGEQVAAVAATSETAAEEALALIKVEYKVLPHVVEDLKAAETGAPQVNDQDFYRKSYQVGYDF